MAKRTRKPDRPEGARGDALTLPGSDPKQVARDATGTDHGELQRSLVDQVAKALWMPRGLSQEQRDEKILAAFNLLREIEPRDGLEGMLATQMVATHSAAMECLRRAMIEDQTSAGRDQNLRHAAKLLALYARQLAALNKHRGKGQQKIVVERVNVASGGRAFVGNVESGAAPEASATGGPAAPRQIEDIGDEPMAAPEPGAPEKAQAKARTKARRKPAKRQS